MRRGLLLLLALLFLACGRLDAANSHVVSPSTTYQVSEHSYCRRVINNHASGQSILVPTKGKFEWINSPTSFVSATPPGVSLAACLDAASLRFRASNSATLTKTFSAEGNRHTWTFSAWLKGSGTGYVFNTGFIPNPTNLGVTDIYFGPEDLRFFMHYGGVTYANLVTTAVFRDPSAWYHVVVRYDDTQATEANRVRIYVNGVQQSLSGSYPSQNFNGWVCSNSVLHVIGQYTGNGGGQYYDGYMAETYLIDGQSLAPSSFGQSDATTLQWRPKTYSGSYGTNGFYLNFSDATNLGKDSSGNGHNWTANNFSTTAGSTYDPMVDYSSSTLPAANVSEWGNYATLNPLDTSAAMNFSDGNLDVTWSANGADRVRGTIAVSSGKWYFEFIQRSSAGQLAGNVVHWGVADVTAAQSTDSGIGSGVALASEWLLSDQGNALNNGSSVSTGLGSPATNDVIQVALDMDAKKIWWGKNGTFDGNPVAGTGARYSNLPTTVAPEVVIWGGANTRATTANFGQRAFAYTPPSGFKALNTYNLPAPAIVTPTAYFDVVTYVGNGVDGLTVDTDLAGTPDLVWVKSRSGALDNVLTDSVRGAGKELRSNTTGAESTSGYVTTLATDGSFAVNTGGSGIVNGSGSSYVAWAWRESPTAGFDIVTWNGTGSGAAARSHGLGVTPTMIIAKARANSAVYNSWGVYHQAIGGTKYLELNTTGAAATNSTWWNNTSPTASAFTTGTQFNESGNSYVAYVFADVPGFSRFGSYNGNGSSDGPFVYTGFRPAMVMVKRTDGTGDWLILDANRNPYNQTDWWQYPNLAVADNLAGTGAFDFLSNGFKLRGASTNINANTGVYVFAAFAEAPFKYANAR